MKLEDAIQQSKGFKNEFQKLMINIYYRNSLLSGRIQSTFKQFGITHQQFNVLRILRGQYPESLSINLLKERMMDKNSDVSRLVSRICDKGLVERSVCEEDKRQMDIKISEIGLELLSELDARVDQFDEKIKGITQEEAKLLNELLDKIE